MPYWIEVTRLSDGEQECEDGWQGLINIGALVDGADAISEQLFGLSQRCSAGKYCIESIASNRGLPSNPSSQVRATVEDIVKHEKQYGTGEHGGSTYALWREVKTAFPGNTIENSDWETVFDLLKRLERSHLFSEDQIRFVVWFNW